MARHLDQGFEILIKGMKAIDRAIGDNVGDESEPKYDNPSTFVESLRENDGKYFCDRCGTWGYLPHNHSY